MISDWVQTTPRLKQAKPPPLAREEKVSARAPAIPGNVRK
jgi:hypothetical protein